MKRISTKIGYIYIVRVPTEAYDFTLKGFGVTMDRSGYYYLIWKPSRKLDSNLKFKESDPVEIIGKLSELSDEECKQFVQRNGIYAGTRLDDNHTVETDILFGWKNYINDGTLQPCEYNTPKESFLSLLISNGIDTTQEHLIIKEL